MKDEIKKYKIIVHDKAAQMLYSHIQFLANVSVPAAKRLRVNLNEAIMSLEYMPFRCPVYPTRNTLESYRQLITGRYKIIYSINEAERIVSVKYILDSHQNNDI
ncbi:MAG: type II toxin-antitoxin system RelE/ParE family toxin [Oscillospiraceae bacterium]|nr:type II toxin-antitoxin system RelE/ParE family toxin [Oscillospiraceae bacterium]